jgi:hypothetical protein
LATVNDYMNKNVFGAVFGLGKNKFNEDGRLCVDRNKYTMHYITKDGGQGPAVLITRAQWYDLRDKIMLEVKNKKNRDGCKDAYNNIDMYIGFPFYENAEAVPAASMIVGGLRIVD